VARSWHHAGVFVLSSVAESVANMGDRVLAGSTTRSMSLSLGSCSLSEYWPVQAAQSAAGDKLTGVKAPSGLSTSAVNNDEDMSLDADAGRPISPTTTLYKFRQSGCVLNP